MANGRGFYSETMSHYQDACREYPALSINDKKFQQRMKSMVQGFNSSGGEEGNSSTLIPSFDIIKEATICILENNKKCAEEILAYKQDLGGNAQILPMVKSYFELCRTTLNSLHKFLVRLCCSRNKLMVLRVGRTVDQKVTKAVTCTVRTVDCFFHSLLGLIGKHVHMLHKLEQARDEEMPTIAGGAKNPTPRSVITIMFETVFAGAVIFSILAASLHAPPVLVVLSTAVISVLSWGPFVEWVEGFWAKAEETEGVAAGEKRIVVIRELEEIKVSTVCNRKRAVETLLKTMDELNKQVEKCCSEVCTARNNFFHKITEPQRRRDRARQLYLEKKDTLLKKMSEMF